MVTDDTLRQLISLNMVTNATEYNNDFVIIAELLDTIEHLLDGEASVEFTDVCHACMHTHMHTHTSMHTHAYVCVCVLVCARPRPCVLVCVHACVCVCTCMLVCAPSYI